MNDTKFYKIIEKLNKNTLKELSICNEPLTVSKHSGKCSDQYSELIEAIKANFSLQKISFTGVTVEVLNSVYMDEYTNKQEQDYGQIKFYKHWKLTDRTSEEELSFFEHICDTLKVKQNIKEIGFTELFLNEQEIGALKNLISSLQNLKKVNLSLNFFTKNDAENIISAKNDYSCSYNFEGNYINEIELLGIKAQTELSN